MTISYATNRMLHFGDCDISGTAYYPAYLNLLNGVIEEFWSAIGYPWHENHLERALGHANRAPDLRFFQTVALRRRTDL